MIRFGNVSSGTVRNWNSRNSFPVTPTKYTGTWTPYPGAGLVSGVDGRTTVRDLITVLAAAFDTPEPVLSAMAVPVVTHLVERGYLIPSAPVGG